jgi:hypothetical protein
MYFKALLGIYMITNNFYSNVHHLNLSNDNRDSFRMHITYYDSKQLEEIGLLYNGQKHGLWLSYFANGTIKRFAYYNKGIPFGISKWFHPNGNIKYDQIWYDSGVNNYNMIVHHKSFQFFDLLIDDSTLYAGNQYDSLGQPEIIVEINSLDSNHHNTFKITDYRGKKPRQGVLTHIIENPNRNDWIYEDNYWVLEWNN